MFSPISDDLVKASNIPEQETEFELGSTNFFTHHQVFL